MNPFVFHVSDIRVEVACEHPAVLRALRAVWGGAVRPAMPTRRVARYAALGRPGDWRVEREGRAEFRSPDDANLFAWFMELFCGDVARLHDRAALLHGALLARGDRARALLGEGDAGKSTLAREGLARGWDFHTDDAVLFDGERVWGVPRAIQFNFVRPGDPVPDYLAECDLESYTFVSEAGETLVRPTLAVPPERAAAAPAEADRTQVFLIRRAAATRTIPLEPLDALAAIHEATLSLPPGGPDLARLARRGRCFRLEWSDAAEAWDAMDAAALS